VSSSVVPPPGLEDRQSGELAPGGGGEEVASGRAFSRRRSFAVD